MEDIADDRPGLLAHAVAELGDILSPGDRAIGETLAMHLDEAGYMRTPAEDIAASLGCPVTHVVDCLERIRRAIEPAGLFAGSLAECLSIQLSRQGRMDPVMAGILSNLNLLARRDFAALRRLTGEDEDGLRSHRFAEARRAACVFEYVYLARPDATIAGRSVYESRVEMGRRLALEQPVEADVVIPVPESGTPAAVGYADASGLPFRQGFVKNAYVGRTFIQPSQTLRQLGIRLKLNVQSTVVAGKRVVVVDDSIVRGNTQRAVVRMLKEAGAAEVHVKISSPPVKWPCFYGIDFATRAELIANGAAVDQIAASIGADSLAYISEEGMIEATGQPRERLCTACFTGDYPIPLADEGERGKGLLEPVAVSPASTVVLDEGGETTTVTATGCEPGPDADDEKLLTETDRTPL